jgi:four helix bundle protein
VVEQGRMLDFQKMDVYRVSLEYLALTREIVAKMPRKDGGLADQMTRASESILLNIAEGVGRRTRADKARHFTIARGSAMESASQIDVLYLAGKLDQDVYQRAGELLHRVVSMLTNMIFPRKKSAPTR